MAAAAPFTYHRPTTVGAAVEAMALEGAHALAGGTDVVTLRANGALTPRHLVDVKHVAELAGVWRADGEVSIGAATTCASLVADGDAGLAAVVDGARIVGAAQTRARATIGGNVVRSSPAGDTLCGLLALDAWLELRSTRGVRVVPVAEFFTGPGRNVRAEDELLTRVAVPRRGGGSAYRRFTYRRAMDLAIVGVGAWVAFEDGVCVDARIALAAVGPTPVPAPADALIGSDGGPDAIAAACDAVVAAAAPIDDVRGTRRHRLRVLRPLARDVLADAVRRAAA